MSANIGDEGVALLKRYLEEEGRQFSESDTKTFDLIVDYVYAEVKSKGKSLDKFDFFALSEKQYQALINDTQFSVFLVINVCDPENFKVIEIPSEILKRHQPKEWKQYFWDRGMLQRICEDLREHNSRDR